MKKLMLIGVSPLPPDRSRNHAAPGLRAWQFAKALLDDGHQVCLVTLGERFGQLSAHPGLKRISLAPGDFTDGERLQQIHDQFIPDALVTAGSYQPTAAACLLQSDRPLWIDLPGDMMAEAQLRAAGAGDPRFVSDYLSILLPALVRADHFSVVSRPQRLSLVGQLGIAGRLGPQNMGHELVSVIPPAVEPAPRVPRKPRPRGVPPDAFLLLSSGGFNTWCDVETLFAGLEQAMERDPRLHFVSAGGEILDHCEGAYARLCELVDSSTHGRRFHLLGWQWPEELGALYAASQLALNIDLPCYEAELGSRNRILDWLRHGLPCITTPASELAHELCGGGVVHPVDPGDPDALARLILELAADPAALKERGAAGREEVLRCFSYGATTGPLRNWATSPACSPDAEPAGPARSTEAENADLLQARLSRSESQLRAVRESMAYRGLRRAEDIVVPLRRWLKGRKN